MIKLRKEWIALQVDVNGAMMEAEEGDIPDGYAEILK
jgi:hypothetical protein